ncbi:MAG: hypothetical protein WCX90_03860 [Thiohalomonadaceae bacterium]|jgi:TPR repeat protein
MRLYLIAALLVIAHLPLVQADFEDGMAAYEKSNYTVAYKEFLQAAKEGNVHAQGKLAGLYLFGVGVEKNYIEAYAWFDLAVRQGDKSAEKFRDAISDQLSNAQLRQASVLAEDYYDKYLAPFEQ